MQISGRWEHLPPQKNGGVGGVVSVANPLLGGSITAGLNVGTDVMNGRGPDFTNIERTASYASGKVLDVVFSSGVGSLSKGIVKGAKAMGIGAMADGVFVTNEPLQVVNGTVQGGLSSGVTLAEVGTESAAKTGYINLASLGRTAHIIAGDATGGGHAWFGSLKSFVNGLTGSKSMFPFTWSNSKIMHAISDVTVNNPWIQQTGKAGAMFAKNGQPVKFVIEGTYEGTKIRVITTHTDIITAFPF